MQQKDFGEFLQLKISYATQILNFLGVLTALSVVVQVGMASLSLLRAKNLSFTSRSGERTLGIFSGYQWLHKMDLSQTKFLKNS